MFDLLDELESLEEFGLAKGLSGVDGEIEVGCNICGTVYVPKILGEIKECPTCSNYASSDDLEQYLI
jgi:rubrerythrin